MPRLKRRQAAGSQAKGGARPLRDCGARLARLQRLSVQAYMASGARISRTSLAAPPRFASLPRITHRRKKRHPPTIHPHPPTHLTTPLTTRASPSFAMLVAEPWRDSRPSTWQWRHEGVGGRGTQHWGRGRARGGGGNGGAARLLCCVGTHSTVVWGCWRPWRPRGHRDADSLYFGRVRQEVERQCRARTHVPPALVQQ